MVGAHPTAEVIFTNSPPTEADLDYDFLAISLEIAGSS